MPSKLMKKTLNTLQIRNDYDFPPAGLRWRSNTFFIIATVAAALFTDLFLYGLVVPILPFVLGERVGVPDDQIQSYVSALLAVYAASSVLSSPFAGLLADRMSTRQAPFLLSLAALIVSTLMLFLGETIPILVIARILQGISGGFVWTIGLALCIETVGRENFGKTIGTIFSFLSVGALCSPVLGGVLYEKAGYLSVCALALSVIAVDFLMRVLVIEKKVARRYESVSGLEQASQSNPQSDVEEHQNEVDEHGNGEEEPLLGKKKDENEDDPNENYRLPATTSRIYRIFPILPCLKNPRILAAFLLALIQALLIGSFDATVPTEAQELFGFNSLKAGLLFVPLVATDLVFGPIIGWCVDRFGTKPVAVFSYTLLTPVLILLRLPHAGGMHQILLYAGLLLVSGIGCAGIGAPSIVEAGAVMERYLEVNPDHFGDNGPYAQLYGMSNMVFSLGLTIGPELAGELKGAIGYGNMNLVLAVIAALTAVISFFYIGPFPKSFRRKNRDAESARG